MRQDFDTQWHLLATDVMTGLKEWRVQHPQATLCAIEQVLDTRLGQLRARLLADLALASAAADLTAAPPTERARCPTCAGPLQARGKQRRTLTTHADHLLVLDRSYGYCPTCKVGAFPPG